MNRISWRKAWTIARHEFIQTVARASYLVVTLGLPLFIGGSMMVGAQMALRSVTGGKEVVVAVVDRAKVVRWELAEARAARPRAEEERADPMFDKRIQYRPLADEAAAFAELNRGAVAAAYVIEPDYLTTGSVTSVVRENGAPDREVVLAERELAGLLRASLVEGKIAGEAGRRAVDPAAFLHREITPQGELRPESGRMQRILKAVTPMLFCLLLWMSIFMSANYLLQSLAQEKQNRVMEVLLSSVRPVELLIGKIVGLGAAGLIQAGVYAGLLGLQLIVPFANAGWRLVLFSLLYVALGYLLFATLMAATGIMGKNVTEINQLASIWSLFSILPGFVMAVTSDMGSWLVRFMSFFPLTAPVTMLIRVSYGAVPLGEILASVLSIGIGIALALRYAAKLFRLGALLYGKRPTGPEIWRWVREA
ncbi:MAG: ABC transporter permease [Blastocatellia bacterium]|nr:ABC transporter permease [Blastocatellia bacterium]